MLWVYEQDEGLAVRAQKMTVDGDCVHESDVDGRIFQEGAANAAFQDPQYPGGRQLFSQYLAEPRTYGATIRARF